MNDSNNKNNEIFSQIQSIIDENNVTLFMKGDANIPMCGFSGTIVQILKKLNVEFKTINVLEDEVIRQGIKEFSDWPTIPQLYLCGEFIGGCDIVKELYLSGELKNIMLEKGIILGE